MRKLIALAAGPALIAAVTLPAVAAGDPQDVVSFRNVRIRDLSAE